MVRLIPVLGFFQNLDLAESPASRWVIGVFLRVRPLTFVLKQGSITIGV